jgi:hypothetical protein
MFSFPSESIIQKFIKSIRLGVFIYIYNFLKTTYNINKNKKNKNRKLEIGPGNARLVGFETLNIINSRNTDYIHDISKGLKIFQDSTFEIVYCSHVLEHIPWYNVEIILNDLFRIIKPSGCLEIWVPDGYKICNVLIDFENNGTDNSCLDGWYRFNPEKDPIKWVSGRIFTYGDGEGSLCHHNWHRGLFTEAYLTRILISAGFKSITKLSNNEVRGFDHGWINLGVRAIK